MGGSRVGAHLQRLPAAVMAGSDYRGRDGRGCHGEIESGAAVMMIVFITFITSPMAAPPPANKEPPWGHSTHRVVTVRDRNTLARVCRPLITSL